MSGKVETTASAYGAKRITYLQLLKKTFAGDNFFGGYKINKTAKLEHAVVQQ